MDAGQIRAAAHPLLALGMIPERADHVPALPMIARAEEPARQRSTPTDAGFVAATGLERPDACRAPIERPAPHVVLLVALRFGRIGRRSDLLPPVRGRAVKLDAEMTVVECRIAPPVAMVAQRQGDIVPQNSTAVIAHCFALRATVNRPLRVETRSVSLIHQPPDRAWNT